ncbi:2-dehydro-3-deoxyphosphogluconate aldolase [Saccharobesus litoralis]|uniref:2-dehydro-3-deoxyphosphogluconate aldolase n=1 Tax=Saccharobesus litoralis TaxID=2172099 RepID=A0A2S0VPX2_9ALTE|nr:bifunctional 4-hydroxy-2-oxoglutarate aldolase/2-dehydro-3-deoxy-phosphogluconate aldolase [Saccharobesus litoralis]AWB66243.1 2-dehydro-3-deoxyphosphogluconate aldolase [Saccharobesus litoralis]
MTQLNPQIQDKQIQRQHSAELIRAAKFVAIIRLAKFEEIAPVIECLVAGGIKVLEVTANTPCYLDAIDQARDLYPDVLIGAGTIINLERARLAIAAGAQFLVTPNTKPEIVEYAHQQGVPVLLGALTPTDIIAALDCGADFIKVFPAGSMGIDYFKDLKGPYSDIDLMPVGGVNVDNVQDWFAAGAVGVGVGNDLTQAVYSEQDKLQRIAHVKKYLDQVPI